jgi:hypothetical protein
MVHSSTPRRWERNTSSLPQRGHLREPTHSEMACVRATFQFPGPRPGAVLAKTHSSDALYREPITR